mgnify:CR=1 FL=1
MTRKIYVLYHASCMDGAAARTAAWLKFRGSAKYIAVQYREPMPVLEDDSDVYILDFSYSREILEALKARMNFLIVLDHHKTAMKDLQGLDYAIFDMKKSGAMLAWEYFHGTSSIPRIIWLVQDRDLWKFNWGDETRRVHAGFQLRRDNYHAWETVTSNTEQGRYLLETIEKDGIPILQYEDVLIQEAMSRIKVVPFLHTQIAIVNSTVLKDEIADTINADTLNRLGTTGVVIYKIDPATNRATLSFRGAPNTDWSWVARHLGGGGHERSCNADVDLTTLHQIIDGRFRKLPRKTWLGSFRHWMNTKLRRWEEALHEI